MRGLFSGKEAGGFTSQQTHEIHKRLILDMGLKDIHFDYFFEIFMNTLGEMDVKTTSLPKSTITWFLSEKYSQRRCRFTPRVVKSDFSLRWMKMRMACFLSKVSETCCKKVDSKLPVHLAPL
jgi:hypothetical protein